MAVLKYSSAKSADMAARYLKNGLALTPIDLKSKKPLERNWQRSFYTDLETAHLFHDRNIGLVLGLAPHYLVDIDLDCPEAIRLAPYFLKETPWVFGHLSAPKSHYLYRCPELATLKFATSDGGMIVEIRSTGAQTVVPGSVHPSEEPIRFESSKWERDLPAEHSAKELQQECSELAAAVLLLRHGWVSGMRDEVAVALCGAMLRSGRSVRDIDTFLEIMASAAGDEELDMRIKAQYQADRLEKGEKVPGVPSLIKCLGSDMTSIIMRWLGIQSLNVVHEFNAEMALVAIGGKARILIDGGPLATPSSLSLMAVSDARQMFLNRGEIRSGKKKIRKFDYWLQSPERRHYSRIVFDPNGSLETEYNLWRGWPLQPINNPDGCQHFLRHVRNVICSQDSMLYEYVLTWLADAIKNPKSKPGVAMVLQSPEEGTGKSLFAKYILKMFGRYGLTITNTEHLFGKHNFNLSNKLMVFADESVWAGNHSHRGILNNLITGDQISFEPKGVDGFSLDSYMRLIMSTNQDWAVPASMSARRFLVLQVDPIKMGDFDYFDKIVQELETDGPACLMAYLMDYKSKVHLRQVPQTEGLLRNKLITLERDNPVAAWWLAKLRTGKLLDIADGWPLEVPSKVILNDYLRNSDRRIQGRPGEVTFAMNLRRIVPPIRVAHRSINSILDFNEISYLHRDGAKNKQVKCYRMAPLTECRAFFAQNVLRAEINWYEDFL